jgi:hypothetical protein
LRLISASLSLYEALLLDEAPNTFFLPLFEGSRIVILLTFEVSVIILIYSVMKMTIIAGFMLVELDKAFSLCYSVNKISFEFVVFVLYFSASHLSVDPCSPAYATFNIIAISSLSVSLTMFEAAHVHTSLCEQSSVFVGQIVCSLLLVLSIVDETWLHDGYLLGFNGLQLLIVVPFGVYLPVTSRILHELSIELREELVDALVSLVVDAEFYN